MSAHTIEKVLFDLASGEAQAAEYARDRHGFLAAYALEPTETGLILDMNVRAMLAMDVNPMLAMRAFSAVEGRDGMPEYLRRLRHRDD